MEIRTRRKEVTRLKGRLHVTGEVVGASLRRRDSRWERESSQSPVSVGGESSKITQTHPAVLE